MVESDRPEAQIYQLRAVLRGISPLIWRRLLLHNNASGIVNYGELHRCGARISTGFVESTINQLIAKRFVKKQQMRWTPRRAHLLLQVRVQTLNDDLHATFERWYPARRNQQGKTLAA